MKKYSIACLALLLVSTLTFQPTPSLAYSTEADAVNPKVKLTEEQREELASIYREMAETKKKLVSKYVEFGLISQEKGEEILTKIDERYNKLREDGFIHWNKQGKGNKRYHKHKKHED